MKNNIFESIVLKMSDTDKFCFVKEDVVSDDEIISEIKQLDSLEEADRDGRTLLINAAFYSRKKVIEYLIKNGVDIHKTDNEQFSALHAAVIGGDVECVRLLLEAGCDANQKNCFGNNSLFLYQLDADREILNLLVKYGANPKQKNNYDVSAEDIYAAYEDIMELLK